MREHVVFTWVMFRFTVALGVAGAVVMYVATRWGKLNQKGQYDRSTVASLAWKVAVLFFLGPPLIYILTVGTAK
jgi:hypothetical protein